MYDKIRTRIIVEVKDDGINFNQLLELSKNPRKKINDSQMVLKYIVYKAKSVSI